MFEDNFVLFQRINPQTPYQFVLFVYSYRLGAILHQVCITR